ncbi:MAG: sigma-54 dependent transcriptional regulator [Gammaproteobacteria bacterium]|nr:sigma-54 dependent transcriptional regulator [Gammaproteobacteria bacterium]
MESCNGIPGNPHRSRSTVLVVEDDETLCEALCDTLRLAGYGVVAAAHGDAALGILASGGISMVIADVQMPHMDGNTLLRRIKSEALQTPVLLMTAYGTVQAAVAAMHEGAADYLVKPFEAEVLVNMVARYALPETAADGELIAADERTRELVDLARRVAGSDATVLISGESGTGKEVLARFLHRHSRRCGMPFVAINCAAIPDNMLEAILFGYEKGAYTGAHQASPGKFEQAQGGTLLLDEISEMNLALQAKLLRVLQEKEVERLGGRKPIALDVRVLATSNRNMRGEVAAQRFREDLYYRINVFPLQIPPLRERVRDIVPLARCLLARAAVAQRRRAPDLSQPAIDRLLQHGWPGNVRELDNVMQRALILHAGDRVEAQDLRFEPVAATTMGAATEQESAQGAGPDSLGEDLRSHERNLILDALKAGMGSRKEAAARLGISPRTLRYKLARLREEGVVIPG